MIRRAVPGQRVTLRYNKRLRQVCRHLAIGTVIVGAKGPRNALVRLDDGMEVVVPFGNIFKREE